MENHIKKAVIIDFFGLPGSGKTTIAHMLASMLKEKSYETQEIIYMVNNSYTSKRRILIKIWDTFCFSTKHFFYMYDLFSMLGKGAFRNIKEMIKQWVNICFVLTSINNGKHTDFVIADQGIVQAALSLTFNCEKADIETFVRKLKEQIKTPMRHVYIAIDIDKDLERLENRNDGKSRIDNEIHIENRINQLQCIQSRCVRIAQSFDCIIVDNSEFQVDCQTVNFSDKLSSIVNFIIMPREEQKEC